MLFRIASIQGFRHLLSFTACHYSTRPHPSLTFPSHSRTQSSLVSAIGRISLFISPSSRIVSRLLFPHPSPHPSAISYANTGYGLLFSCHANTSRRPVVHGFSTVISSIFVSLTLSYLNRPCSTVHSWQYHELVSLCTVVSLRSLFAHVRALLDR